MTIKILCACGTKFAFDAAPGTTRVDGAVDCPVCGADQTNVACGAWSTTTVACTPASSSRTIAGAPPTVPVAHILVADDSSPSAWNPAGNVVATCSGSRSTEGG